MRVGERDPRLEGEEILSVHKNKKKRLRRKKEGEPERRKLENIALTAPVSLRKALAVDVRPDS